MATLTQVMVCVNRAEAIRAGINGTESPVSVELDVSQLSQVDRDDLADRITVVDGRTWLRCKQGSDGTWRVRNYVCNRGSVPNPLVVVSPTQDGVLEAILRERIEGEAYMAEQAKERADEAARLRDLTLGFLAAKKTVRSTWCVEEDGTVTYYASETYARVPDCEEIDWPYPRDEAVVASPQARAWVAEIRAANDLRIAGAIAAETARREAAVRDRQQWIAQHGSARLQRMVAEGIGHEKTYQAERAKWDQAEFDAALAAERPGWGECEPKDLDTAIADVSTRTLAILDAGRVIDPEAKLAKHRPSGKYVVYAEFRGRTIYWPRD